MNKYDISTNDAPIREVGGYKPSVLSDLLDGYVAEARRLVDTLNAFDGSGIPRSDAYDAFALLRKIAKREAV